MKKSFIFLLFFFFLTKAHSQKMEYDLSLVEIKIIEKFGFCFPENQDLNFPDDLNLNFIKGNSINYDLISSALNSNILYHGKRKVLSAEVIILSEKIPVEMNPSLGGKWYGYLLIMKDDFFYSIKIFEQSMDSGVFQKSYLCGNYLITMKFIDQEYDLVFEEDNKRDDVFFQVIRIRKNGGIDILNKNEGTKIAKKYIPAYFD